jgi:hypothetical protein
LPGIVVYVYNPSYTRGRGRRIMIQSGPGRGEERKESQGKGGEGRKGNTYKPPVSCHILSYAGLGFFQ